MITITDSTRSILLQIDFMCLWITEQESPVSTGWQAGWDRSGLCEKEKNILPLPNNGNQISRLPSPYSLHYEILLWKYWLDKGKSDYRCFTKAVCDVCICHWTYFGSLYLLCWRTNEDDLPLTAIRNVTLDHFHVSEEETVLIIVLEEGASGRGKESWLHSVVCTLSTKLAQE